MYNVSHHNKGHMTSPQHIYSMTKAESFFFIIKNKTRKLTLAIINEHSTGSYNQSN